MASTDVQKSGWRSWAKSIFDIAVIVLVVMAAKTAIAEPFYVPSGSMEPTLLIGDELLATKFPYGYGSASLPSFWVKRVIGLPGERIALHDGQVFIDGQALALQPDGTGQAENDDGSHMPARRLIETLPGGRTHIIFKLTPLQPLDNMAETVVPPGHVFVMGDNRDNSADSRVPLREGGVGMLPVDDLVGRVDGIVGSWDLGMKSRPVWTWPQGLRLSRFFSAVH
jgi:signal peptidase I